MTAAWLASGTALCGVVMWWANRPAERAIRAPRVFIAAAVALAVIAAANYLVNPFGRFPTRLFEPMTLHSRADKLRLLAAAPPADVVIFGSSPSFEMAPEQIRQATGLRAFNATVHGASPRDYAALLAYLRQHGRTPRFLIVALSFEQLRSSVNVGFEPGDPLGAYLTAGRVGAPWRADLASLLALDQTTATVRRLRAAATSGAPAPAYRFEADGRGRFAHARNLTLGERRGGNPELTFADLGADQWGHLASLLDQCRRDGTGVVAFVPPLQPQLAQLWGETTSLHPITDRLVERLRAYRPAPVLAVHDFRRVESFGGTGELFMDMRHPDAEANRLILAILVRDIAAASARPAAS